MDSLQVDSFTKEILLFQIKLEKETDPIKKQSYLGLINKLKRKRDSLSKHIWKKTYQEAVTSGTYDPWL